jgi:hypothetical protein
MHQARQEQRPIVLPVITARSKQLPVTKFHQAPHCLLHAGYLNLPPEAHMDV